MSTVFYSCQGLLPIQIPGFQVRADGLHRAAARGDAEVGDAAR